MFPLLESHSRGDTIGAAVSKRLQEEDVKGFSPYQPSSEPGEAAGTKGSVFSSAGS